MAAFFQRTFKFTYYNKSALERLAGESTFKFRALWSVRGGRVKVAEVKSTSSYVISENIMIIWKFSFYKFLENMKFSIMF